MGWSCIQKLVEQTLIRNQVPATETLVCNKRWNEDWFIKTRRLCSAKASCKVPRERLWKSSLSQGSKLPLCVCLRRLFLILFSLFIFLSLSSLASGHFRFWSRLRKQTIWVQISALSLIHHVTLGKYLTLLCLSHLLYKMGMMTIAATS